MLGFRKSAFSVTQGRVVPVYGMKEFHHVHDGKFARKLIRVCKVIIANPQPAPCYTAAKSKKVLRGSSYAPSSNSPTCEFISTIGVSVRSG
jgi:hypothetical protein